MPVIVEVVGPAISHGGKLHRAGSLVDLPDVNARAFISLGRAKRPESDAHRTVAQSPADSKKRK